MRRRGEGPRGIDLFQNTMMNTKVQTLESDPATYSNLVVEHVSVLKSSEKTEHSFPLVVTR